ncbi:uncharacterized protein J7T54_004255, partial [Emericellopsis cladophorae]
MYRSLLVQLLKAFPYLQSVLDDTDIVPRSQQDCPNINALKELLRSAVTALGQRSFTSFIDALDECDEQEVRDMVEFFEDLAEITTEGGIQFRVCFSSRPYPYIDMHRGALLVLEDELGHGDDLAEYVKTRLKIHSRSLLAELQSQILDKAAGIFMWIVLVVDILNEESRQGALALRTRLAGIPPKLSDLFRSILARDEKEPERLLICILWVLCAKRPLSPGEFRHAVWAGLLDQRLSDPDLPDNTDQDAVALVTSSSKGLVEVTKSKQPTVQFIHESSKRESAACIPGETYGYPFFAALAGGHKVTAAALLGLPSMTCDGVDIFEVARALANGHGPLAQLLLNNGADFNARDKFGRTELMLASQDGHEEVARLLIEKGADVHARDSDGRTALIWASEKGHEAVARLLIDKGADVNAQTNNKGTALIWASENEHEAVARLLIDKGADVHARDSDGRTALIWAS